MLLYSYTFIQQNEHRDDILYTNNRKIKDYV